MSNNSNNISLHVNDTAMLLPMWELCISVPVLPLLICLYSAVLFTIINTKGPEYNNSFYTLLIGYGIADIGMLCFNIYSIIYDVLRKDFLGGSIDSFLGFVLYWALGWYSTQMFILIVTTNRFIAIVLNAHYSYFTVKLARMLCIFTFVLSFVIVTPSYIILGFHYSPLFKVPFFTVEGDIFTRTFAYFALFDEIFSYVVSFYVILAYVIISLYLIKFYKSFLSMNAGYKKEVIFFIQGVCFAIFLCFVNSVHWYLAPFSSSLNRIGNWIYTGLNPIIYLTLDGKLRRDFLRIFSTCKRNQVSP
uniref:G-protein coupled receptors family 1 profile domain-containing protein n=1 Tax=Romanomermis culicivorax TaxID=13658 RepID=A0A915J184_ROMCU